MRECVHAYIDLDPHSLIDHYNYALNIIIITIANSIPGFVLVFGS